MSLGSSFKGGRRLAWEFVQVTTIWSDCQRVDIFRLTSLRVLWDGRIWGVKWPLIHHNDSSCASTDTPEILLDLNVLYSLLGIGHHGCPYMNVLLLRSQPYSVHFAKRSQTYWRLIVMKRILEDELGRQEMRRSKRDDVSCSWSASFWRVLQSLLSTTSPVFWSTVTTSSHASLPLN